MKKLFAMAVALFTATAMFAQPEAGTITVQPKAGIAVSSISSDIIDFNSKVGFVGGVEAGYQICKPFAITVGLNYAQYGGKINGLSSNLTSGIADAFGNIRDYLDGWDIDIDDIDVDDIYDFDLSDIEDAKDVKWNANYITIPVLANYYPCKGLAIKAGLEPAIKVSSSFSSDAGSIDNNFTKGFMLSIPVGASYEYNNVVLDARYNIGVTKMSDYLDNPKNNSFVVTLGYKFAL